jgi:L1 cell adhesion molecule like protein
MDLVNSVAKVVEIANQIKELVEKVNQNKEECKKIATRVERLRAIVACLDNTDVSSEQTMIDALNELEETFLRALKLVKACQTKNVVWLFLTAGNVSKQLREVKDEIMEHMHIANFSNGVQQTVMLTEGYMKDPAAKPKVSLIISQNYCTYPSLLKCSAYMNIGKSNDVKFDQVCSKKYEDLEYQNNTIRIIIIYIFRMVYI